MFIFCFKVKNKSRFIPLTILGGFTGWSLLPEKLQIRYMSLVDPSLGPENARVSADSREEFFRIAVELWKDNPIFGAGPGCFAEASGTGMQPHSLYGQAISDMGVFGVMVVVFLVFSFFVNFLVGRRYFQAMEKTSENKFYYFILIASVVAVIQLLFLGLAGHNLYRYTWLWYGAFSLLAVNFLQIKVRSEYHRNSVG